MLKTVSLSVHWILRPADPVKNPCCLVNPILTDIHILLSHALRSPSAICLQVHDTAGAHDGLKFDDLIQWYTEHLVCEEFPAWLVECFMRAQVVVSKSKFLTAEI
jgi:hypothetical protein